MLFLSACKSHCNQLHACIYMYQMWAQAYNRHKGFDMQSGDCSWEAVTSVKGRVRVELLTYEAVVSRKQVVPFPRAVHQRACRHKN